MPTHLILNSLTLKGMHNGDIFIFMIFSYVYKYWIENAAMQIALDIIIFLFNNEITWTHSVSVCYV